MKALVTSCGRQDLLKKTLSSFLENQHYAEITIKIHEDRNISNSEVDYSKLEDEHLAFTNGIGQHASIEKFLSENKDEKYYLHLEDDWQFENSYDWIKASVDIMEADKKIIKVLCRKDLVHKNKKFVGKYTTSEGEQINMYELTKWTDQWINNDWYGFSWNPGITRLDLLSEFMPFTKWEQQLTKKIHAAGYKVIALEKGVYSHIGEGRSTHI